MAFEQIFEDLRNKSKMKDIAPGRASFLTELFTVDYSHLPFASTSGEVPEEKAQAASPEKIETFKSLETFVKEKLETVGSSKIEFPGGEVHEKEVSENDASVVGLEALISLDNCLHLVDRGNNQIKVLFVGETPMVL